MRILLTTDAVGGVWTFTRELAGGLLAEGDAVCLVCFGAAPSLSHMADVQALTEMAPSLFSFQSSAAPLEWMDDNDRTWSEGALFLEALIEVFDPDVVHSNQFCWGMAGGGRPTLVTAHSDVLSWAESTLPGGIAQLEGSADAEWFARCRKLVGDGLQWAESVVAPTQWMAGRLRDLYGLGGEPRVVLNGRTVSSPPDDILRRMQAVTAGRLWDPAKGLAVLGEVRSPLPILLAGEARFGGAAVELPEGVTALGRLSSGELHEVFRGSAIYLGTSLYEPFGLAPLEAALCGCALLLRDIPTFRELWEGAALFFRDAKSLETQLKALAEDAGLLRSKQGEAMVRGRRYSAEAMKAEYRAEYRRLAGRFGGSPDLPAASEDHAA